MILPFFLYFFLFFSWMQQPLSLFSRLEERDLIAEWGDTFVIHFSGSLRQHAYCIYKIIIKKKKRGKSVTKKCMECVTARTLSGSPSFPAAAGSQPLVFPNHRLTWVMIWFPLSCVLCACFKKSTQTSTHPFNQGSTSSSPHPEVILAMLGQAVGGYILAHGERSPSFPFFLLALGFIFRLIT